MQRPQPSEYAPYYNKYIPLATEDDVLIGLQSQLDETLELFRHVPEEAGNVRHPPYTWSVKQVLGHVIDSERIFSYRALRFARGDATTLPGYEENDYARTGEFDRIPLKDLVDEFRIVRHASIALFKQLPDAAWDRRGEANKFQVTVRALAFILVGHSRHHVAILRKRLS